MQQEYFHTHKACSDLYFKIAVNMKNHEKMVDTSVCFHAKSSKDRIHSIILEKKGLKSLKYQEKNNKFTICDVAASYDLHACSLYVFLRGSIHIKICQTSHATSE